MQAKDNSEIEAKQREKELAFLEAELDAIPDNFTDDIVIEDSQEIQEYLLGLLKNSENLEI